jgi:hypothetical protein
MRTRSRTGALATLSLLLVVSCGDGDAILFPAPTELSVEAATVLEGTAGLALEAPPVVRVLDARGNAAPGVEVSFRIEEGEGSIASGTVLTDALGRASPGAWVLGETVGANVLVADAGDLGTIRFEAHAGPGAPAVMEPASPVEREGGTGFPVSEPPAVRVFDQFGNPVPGVPIDFRADPGSGSLDGTLIFTSQNGVAAVRGWTLGPEEGNHRVRATARDLGELGEIVFEAQVWLALEFTIESVQLNQGSQTFEGDIGGVADRPGLLRVVVRANHANLETPDVLVRLYQGGNLIREELLPAPGDSVPMNPDLHFANHTWNLVLDGPDVVPGLSVVAVVDPDSAISLYTRENARFPAGEGTASLSVATLPTFNIVFFPIASTVHQTLGSITAGNTDVFLEATRQWIPAGSLVEVVREPYVTGSNLSTHDGWIELIQDIQALRTAEGATDEYYHGIIGDFSGIQYGGLGYVPSNPNSPFRTALSYDRLPAATGTVAHELGHNLGRFHAPCGNPGGPDPGFPYSDGGIGPPGYDILGGGLRQPATHRDYMSYCAPRWTSDYTYHAILEWRRDDPLAAHGSLMASAGGETTGLLLWGRVTSTGVVLNPAFTLTAPPALPEVGGPYEIRGVREDGAEAFRFSFAGEPVSESPDPAERHFAFFVPLDAGGIDALRRIELSGPAGHAGHEAPDAPPPDRPRIDEPEVLLESDIPGHWRLRWDADRFPMALVRDADTGRILSFARDGEARLPTTAPAPDRLEVLLSDGVRSVRAR